MNDLLHHMEFAMAGLDLCLTPAEIETELRRSVANGISADDLKKTIILNAKSLMQRDADFAKFAARIHLSYIYEEVLGWNVVKNGLGDLQKFHARGFKKNLQRAVKLERLDPRLLDMDLNKLAAALDPAADLDFDYLGISTLYDRYLIVDKKSKPHRRLESPQLFWMRVAMGLFIQTPNPEEKIIELYNLYKSRRFCSSTPTLFNSGTLHSQMSSCYLYHVSDTIEGIFGRGIMENAQLAKWAGGLGGSWTAVRGTGAYIKGTNGESQGVIPFLKVHNDQLISTNQHSSDTLVPTLDGIIPLESVIPMKTKVLGSDGRYHLVRGMCINNDFRSLITTIRTKHSSKPFTLASDSTLSAIQGVGYPQTTKKTLQRLRTGSLKEEWLKIGGLQLGDYVGIPIPKAIQDVPELSIFAAWLYGVMLGNGHIIKGHNEAGVTCHSVAGAKTLSAVRDILRKNNINFWESVLHSSCTSIRWTHVPSLFGFGRDHLYDERDNKRIHPKFLHLPYGKLLAIVDGLVITDGNVSRGSEVTFSTSSRPLGEGLRYQLLRLGVPTHAYCRTRDNDHIGVRKNGSVAHFVGESFEMKVSIPMVAALAWIFNVPPLTRFNWFQWEGKVFTRVKSVQSTLSEGSTMLTFYVPRQGGLNFPIHRPK